MAVIGYLGKGAEDGILFQVSADRLETLDNFSWSGSARYATHQRHSTHALTEFTGLDPDKISFDMQLLAELGVDPMAELVTLWDYLRQGDALQLVLGNHGYGKYRWVIDSLKIKGQYFDAAGDLYCAVVSVSLLEYLSAEF